MSLNFFYLGQHKVRVALHLTLKDVELVLGVFLHEQVVLVEHLDGLVDFDDFASLYVLKIDLPLRCVLAYRGDFGLQLGDLVLGELLQRAHHLFNANHFFGQSLVRHARMLDRLFLQGVHLAH